MKGIEYIVYQKTGENSLIRKKHIHDNSYEILQVLEGNGNMVIDDKLYPLTSGTVFLISPNTVHSSAPSDGTYIRNTINITIPYWDQICSLADHHEAMEQVMTKQCLTVQNDTKDTLSSQFEILAAMEMPNQKEDSFYKIACISRILSLLLKADSQIPVQNNKVANILHYIDDNLTQQMSLDELAKQAHLNKFYFSHVFQEYTGMSPINYITTRRIALAKEMLINSTLSISEIAIRTGFRTFSNFSNIFTRNEGMTPKEYRKSMEK